jgi:uncharacterized protein (DUF1015 family)
MVLSSQLREHIVDTTNALENLDTQILFTTVLFPILNIEDLRNDERIEYLSQQAI